MIDNWDAGLNLKAMLQHLRPVHVVEAGALNNETTRQLLGLMPEVGYRLTVISDDVDEALVRHGVQVMRGVSYLEFAKLPDASVDFCIVDTDHNYWTVLEELLALHPKLTPNAHVVFHDVETFYYDTGMADGYGVDVPYPKQEIESRGMKLGSLGTGILDFLSLNRFAYRLVRWLPERNGVAVIRKNPPEIPVGIFQAAPGKGRRACSV